MQSAVGGSTLGSLEARRLFTKVSDGDSHTLAIQGCGEAWWEAHARKQAMKAGKLMVSVGLGIFV